MVNCKLRKILNCILIPSIIIAGILSIIIVITQLTIGIIFLDKCPIRSWIPIYNLVSGSTGIFIVISSAILWSISKLKKINETYLLCAAIALVLVTLFHFGWSIFGGYQTFPLRTQDETQYDDPNLSTYCNPILYWMTFSILIIYILLLALAGLNVASVATDD